MTPNRDPLPLRRQLAAAVMTLLGASLGHAEPASGEASTRPLEPLRVDPGLLGSAPAAAAAEPRAHTAAQADADAEAARPRRPRETPRPARDPVWSVDSGLLFYKEGDGRVETTEAVVSLKKNEGDEHVTTFKLIVDSLSGGSPNGALPSRATQTFSTPSGTTMKPPSPTATTQTCTTPSGNTVVCGSGSHSTLYTVAPGQLPIDPTFHDERYAFSANTQRPLDDGEHLSYGASASHELDFVSVSGNAALAKDFNNKNTTLSAGVNLEADSIRPIGGAPIPWSDYAQFQKQGNKGKRVQDLLVGVTQVMSRRWISQVNYSLDRSSGYQNDPYKIISVLNADGSAATDVIGSSTYNRYLYEARPERRSRKSLYWENKFAFDRDVADISYRRMSDDWGISSDTVDVHYRWAMNDGSYLEPHGRWYRQTAADFFRFYLLQGAPALAYVSADPRLAKFNADTLGLKWGLPIDAGSELSLRVERYVQKGKGPAVVPAQLQGLDLYPGLRAWIVQAGLDFGF